MLKNYLTIALRNLQKQKGYSFINIFGLGVGMACCLLILLYIQDELRYDRFNEKADRIYRVTTELHFGDQRVHAASSMAPLAPMLRSALPEVRQAARLGKYKDQLLVRRGDRVFYEDHFFFADSTVFDVFTFPLLEGDPQTALAEPHAVVLSETMARKYFGSEDPVGQVLTVEGRFDLRVTGVMADVPSQSHVRPAFLASFDAAHAITGTDLEHWGNIASGYTYVVLPEGYHPEALEAKLPGLVDTYAATEMGPKQPSSIFTLHVQPLTGIHLRSEDLANELEATGEARYLYLFASIAVLVLVIACINFMNLATARSAGRGKEVGVRKVMGAHRAQLVRQFISESMLFAGVALAVALTLVELLLPLFNALSGKELAAHYASNLPLLGTLAGVTLFVGFVSGSYPALFLSGFRPVEVLKGKSGRHGGAATLRKVLVVFQFGISIALMIGAVVMGAQMDYFRHKNLGFDEEQVVVVPMQQEEVRRQYAAFKQALGQLPGIVRVGGASHTPGQNSASIATFHAEGVAEDQAIFTISVDEDFIETLGIHLAAGRDFSRDFPTDTSEAYLLNEAAIHKLGWTDAVGKQFSPKDEGRKGRVIGVVDDFHLFSVDTEVQPLVIACQPKDVYHLVARVRPDRVREALAGLERTWKAFAPGLPFEYSFMDQDFARQYVQTERLSRTMRTFMALALLIACLGLFGLAAFTAEQRTKEIGIRKVLGASVPGLVVLLARDFVSLIAVAYVVAAPLAYFAMRHWLAEFPYRVALSWEIFLVTGLAAFVVAAATVSYQAVRAALADPVKSLRYE